MQWTGWGVARVRARPALPAVLIGLVVMAAAVLGVVAGLTDAVASAAARDALAGPSPATLTVRARAGSDIDAQDRRARSALEAGFAPARVVVTTTIDAEPVRVGEARVVARHAGSGTEGLALTGREPSADDEVALQADAAQRLGVRPGDTIEVEGRLLTVTATWRPVDPSESRWVADPLAVRGAEGALIGPLLVSRTVITQLPGTPVLAWFLEPALDRVEADDFAALSSGAARAKELAEVADDTGRGVTVHGALADRVASAAAGWADARRLGIVPIGLAWAVAAAAVGQVAHVVALARARETRLLLARGTTVAQWTGVAAVEAALVVTVGGLAGAGVGVAALRVLAGSWAQTPQVLVGASVGAATAFAALVGVGAAHAGMAVRSGAAAQGRRDVAAALARIGVSRAGPVVPSRGVVSWLAGAHVLRGAATATVPLVLSILALGGVTITGLFGGASRAVGADIAALERGADLRAVLGGPPVGGMPALPDLGTSTTIAGSSPAWVDETAMVGDVPVKLVAGPVDRLGAAAALPAGLSLPPELADHEPPGPLPVPDGARELTVRLTGGLDLDPWQLAAARQLPELGRRQAEAPYVVDPIATARDLTRDELERLREGADARVEVLIRDTSTGISRRIPAVDLAVGGLDLVWGDTVEARPGRIVAAEGMVTLPESGTHVVDGLLLRVSGGPAGATVRLVVAVSADGTPLRPGASWTSDVAVPEAFAGPYRRLMAETPVEVGLTETVSDGGLAGVAVATNRPDVPPLLTSTAEGWQVVGEPWALSTLRMGPRIAFTGRDPAAAVTSAGAVAVPVAVTPATAGAAALEVGDTFDVDAFQRRMPAVVAAVTAAVPGTTDAHAVLADSRAVARALAATLDPMPWPREVWVRTDDVAANAGRIAALPGVETVVVAPPGSPVAELARRTFWAGAAGGLILAIAGILATLVAQADARRGEVEILVRLGLAGAAQGRSRALEHGTVLVLAALLGVLAGAAVGRVGVPPLVRTAVGADPAWPVPLSLDTGPFGGLLALFAAGVGLGLAMVVRTVSRQAARVGRGHG